MDFGSSVIAFAFVFVFIIIPLMCLGSKSSGGDGMREYEVAFYKSFTIRAHSMEEAREKARKIVSLDTMEVSVIDKAIRDL